MNFREHHRWHLVSESGYYAIQLRELGGFTAYHIPALWATPVALGIGLTSEDAGRLCEEHSQRATHRSATATNYQGDAK